MVNQDDEKTKQILSFSKKQVEKAGRAIRKQDGDITYAKSVIQNYRAAHLYPLQIIKNLVWKHVRKLNFLDSATIVRRLKRLPTIIDKLQRNSLDGKTDNAISLKRMHDIGGCRVILENLTDLYALDASLNASRSQHGVKVYDYISQPKSSGYRGIHRVYKSYQYSEQHTWKGFQIEVQLRTHLQHLWATTVEIVDLIEQETLKTNPQAASTQWKRLFVIMSDFLAVKDGTLTLTKQQTFEYKKELRELNDTLSAFEKLTTFNSAFQIDEIKTRSRSGFTLLTYSHIDHKGRVKTFGSQHKHFALAQYQELEEDPDINALLVAGRDLTSIEKAYPNYISDTSEFLKEFSHILLT